MKSPLEEMSLEALWQLFPVVLKPHNPIWIEQFEKEKNTLYSVLKSEKIRWIKHIGSSAIKTIQAKPIVDILVEFKTEIIPDECVESLKKAGYIVMQNNDQRVSLNKGYTPSGYAEEVFHIHLRKLGDHGELYFRDYLMAFPEEAKRYETLKESLALKYKHNRDEYTNQKTVYIQKVTSKAKSMYLHKYE